MALDASIAGAHASPRLGFAYGGRLGGVMPPSLNHSGRDRAPSPHPHRVAQDVVNCNARPRDEQRDAIRTVQAKTLTEGADGAGDLSQ